MTPEQRGERARQLLQDPILQEALSAMTPAYIAAMRKCDAKDDMGRYRYAVALDVIDGVSRHLETVLALGRLPEKAAQEFQTDTIFKKITRQF